MTGFCRPVPRPNKANTRRRRFEMQALGTKFSCGLDYTMA
jgi:hypothetical protein